MNRKVSLSLNDLDIADLFIRDHFQSELLGGVVESKISLALQKNSPSLSALDLKGKITWKVTDGDQVVFRFGGVITHTEDTPSEYILHCKDPNQYLNELPMQGGFGPGILMAEQVYYLVAEITPDLTYPQHFSINESQTLSDTGLLSTRRTFTYIAPLPWCELKTDKFEVLPDVWLYSGGGSNDNDEANINRLVAARSVQEWSDGGVRIKMYLDAHSFLEAFKLGSQRLSEVLDVISFGASFATPVIRWKSHEHYHAYRRNRTLANTRETPWAYM
jgi:hypothetical protein